MDSACSSHRWYNLKQIFKEMLRVAAREIYLLIFFLGFHFVSVITAACVYMWGGVEDNFGESLLAVFVKAVPLSFVVSAALWTAG